MTSWAWRGIFALWLLGVASGSAYAWRYSLTDAGSSAIRSWPAQAALPRDAHWPTLVMFVMAHCPCSAASLHELNALLQDTRVRAHAYIVVDLDRPDKTDRSDEPEASPRHDPQLLATARAIPHAEAIEDTHGTVRRSFAARTSGETHLYDPRGRLLFKGGITAARGHEGLSHSRQLLSSLITGEPAPQASTIESPTYGCHFAQNEEKRP